jgi:3-oxoacyl-[acyl-carrier protein] reductase
VVMGDAAALSTIEELKAVAEERFGRVDMYVSNAARRLYKDFFETTNEDWHEYLNQQLTASWYLAKAFVPGMQAARWGRIIHMNGPDGWTGGWLRAPHSTAKGGLHTLTKSLAEGLGQFGITVNDVDPGHTETIRDMETHPNVTREHDIELAARIAARKLPQPEDIAWAIRAAPEISCVLRRMERCEGVRRRRTSCRSGVTPSVLGQSGAYLVIDK